MKNLTKEQAERLGIANPENYRVADIVWLPDMGVAVSENIATYMQWGWDITSGLHKVTGPTDAINLETKEVSFTINKQVADLSMVMMEDVAEKVVLGLFDESKIHQNHVTSPRELGINPRLKHDILNLMLDSYHANPNTCTWDDVRKAIDMAREGYIRHNDCHSTSEFEPEHDGDEIIQSIKASKLPKQVVVEVENVITHDNGIAKAEIKLKLTKDNTINAVEWIYK